MNKIMCKKFSICIILKAADENVILQEFTVEGCQNEQDAKIEAIQKLDCESMMNFVLCECLGEYESSKFYPFETHGSNSNEK